MRYLTNTVRRILIVLIAGIIVLLLLYPVLPVIGIAISNAILTHSPNVTNYFMSYNLPSYAFYISYTVFLLVVILLPSIALSYLLAVNSGIKLKSPSDFTDIVLRRSFFFAGLSLFLYVPLILSALFVTYYDILRTIQEFGPFFFAVLLLAIRLMQIGIRSKRRNFSAVLREAKIVRK